MSWDSLYEKYRTMNFWSKQAPPVNLFEMGADAYAAGRPPEDNPLTDLVDRAMWYRGWCLAQKQHWGL